MYLQLVATFTRSGVSPRLKYGTLFLGLFPLLTFLRLFLDGFVLVLLARTTSILRFFARQNLDLPIEKLQETSPAHDFGVAI